MYRSIRSATTWPVRLLTAPFAMSRSNSYLERAWGGARGVSRRVSLLLSLSHEQSHANTHTHTQTTTCSNPNTRTHTNMHTNTLTRTSQPPGFLRLIQMELRLLDAGPVAVLNFLRLFSITSDFRAQFFALPSRDLAFLLHRQPQHHALGTCFGGGGGGGGGGRRREGGGGLDDRVVK